MSCSSMREWLEECVKRLNQCFSRDRDGIIAAGPPCLYHCQKHSEASYTTVIPSQRYASILQRKHLMSYFQHNMYMCTTSSFLREGITSRAKPKQSVFKGQLLRIQESGWRSPSWNARKKSNWGSTVKTITTIVLYGFTSTSVDAPQPVKIWQKAHLRWQRSSKQRKCR